MNQDSPPGNGGLEPSLGMWGRMEALRARGMRARNLFWTRAVSYRIGAFIALAALRSPITPNMLTLAGLLCTVGGAALVWLSAGDAGYETTAVVLVVWQLSYGFDCSDGLLARTRGTSSAYGAWIDQVTDFVGHAVIGAVLVDFVVRADQLPAGLAIWFTALVIGTGTLQIFAAAQRDLIFGSSAARSALTGRGAILAPLANLVDNGLYLFVAAILLAAPGALVIYLLVASGLSAGFVAAQVLLLRGRSDRLDSA